jgi:hypothetical protein
VKAADDGKLDKITDQDMEADETSDEDEEGVKRPKFGEGLWGVGPPLGAQGHGQVKAANLRMRLVRLLCEHCDVKKVVFALACGKFRGSPFGQDLVQKARADWIGFWTDYERFSVSMNEKRCASWRVGVRRSAPVRYPAQAGPVHRSLPTM